jgi:diguanylate cyclase (GGDEF)-like protein
MTAKAPDESASSDSDALQERLRALEIQSASQAREIRALERIEALRERVEALEREKQRFEGQLKELHAVLALNRGLSATLDPAVWLREVLPLVTRVLPGDAVALWMFGEGGTVLQRAAVLGSTMPATPIPRGGGIVGLVAATGQALLVSDLAAESRVEPAELLTGPGGTYLAVPCRSPAGSMVALLTAQSATPHDFPLATLDLAQAIGGHLAAAWENVQLYQRTREMATRDELTGLWNRRHLAEQLDQEIQRARRYGHPFAVVLVDIDDFKLYNDTHGHLAGDELLRQLAGLLLRTTRRADVVARIGGEEFVIVLPESDTPGAAALAEKVRDAVAAAPFPGRESQPEGRLTVTLGFACFPDDGQDPVVLLELADRALYLGKHDGGNCVRSAPRPPTPRP